jgi:hypothetical protein
MEKYDEGLKYLVREDTKDRKTIMVTYLQLFMISILGIQFVLIWLDLGKFQIRIDQF